MNNGFSITDNFVETYRNFESLTDKELKKFLGDGLRKNIRQIRDDVKKNLRARIKKANVKNPKYQDSLVKGVRSTRVFENKRGKNIGELFGKVRIDSTRQSGSGSYRLAILESGSYLVGERFATTRNGVKLRKPKSTGVLKGAYFFKDAIEGDNSTFHNEMDKSFDKGINEALKKL